MGAVLLAPLFINSQAMAAPLVLLIDPGHGGSDHGAVYSGTKEAEIVLTISQKINRLFQNDPRFKVRLTRNDETTLGLPERIKIAEDINADLIVSVHANASPDSRAHGIELYVPNPMPMEEEELFLAHQESQIIVQKPEKEDGSLSKSQDIAAIVGDLKRQNKFFKSIELSEILKKSWRMQKPKSLVSIRQAPFYVISQGHIPSVLVEVGFLSHAQESVLLKDPNYQTQVAQIIHESILRYLNIGPAHATAANF
jgi:N-acetylmuramoyl-L-alanine amidase